MNKKSGEVAGDLEDEEWNEMVDEGQNADDEEDDDVSMDAERDSPRDDSPTETKTGHIGKREKKIIEFYGVPKNNCEDTDPIDIEPTPDNPLGLRRGTDDAFNKRPSILMKITEVKFKLENSEQSKLAASHKANSKANQPIPSDQTNLEKFYFLATKKEAHSSDGRKPLPVKQIDRAPGQLDFNFARDPDAVRKAAVVKFDEVREVRVRKVGDFYLHAQSLLNDPMLQPRNLTKDQSKLFQIIMNWVPDQYREMQRKLREMHALGRFDLDSAEHIEKDKHLRTLGDKEVTIFTTGPLHKLYHDLRQGVKKKKDEEENLELLEDEDDKKEYYMIKEGKKKLPELRDIPNHWPKRDGVFVTRDEAYSASVTIDEVEKFDWTYERDVWNPLELKWEKAPAKLEGVEGIYINPHWKQSKIGDFFRDRLRNLGKEVPVVAGEKEDQGLTMEEFKKLKIPMEVMADGMLFIWVEKENIQEMVTHLSKEGFTYVENVCFLMMDRGIEPQVTALNTIDATPTLIREDYTFLCKSHRSLLMFRRSKDHLDQWERMLKKRGEKRERPKLELRHQRTGDVVVNWYDPENPLKKPDFYIYRLIEILLPKAKDSFVYHTEKPEAINKDRPQLKLVELWSQNNVPRKHWLKVHSSNPLK